MQRLLQLALIGYAGLALAGSAALAQDAGSHASLNVAPDASVTAPGSAVRGFDAPPPALKLTLSPRELAAAPSPDADLAGQGRVLANAPVPAADRDSYFNTRDYQDKTDVVHRPGRDGAGRQFAGTAEAMALQGVIQGAEVLINGK